MGWKNFLKGWLRDHKPFWAVVAGLPIFLLVASWLRPFVLSLYYLEKGGVLLERSLVAVYSDRLAPEQIVDMAGLVTAMTYLEKSAESDPRNVQALRLLGRAYLSLGQPEMALRFFQKAIEIRPRNPLLRLELGDVYDSLGYTENAIREYQAGGIGSRSVPLIANYLKLADVQMTMGSGELAINLWYRVLSLDPDCLYALYSLYKVHQELGDAGNAAVFRERLTSVDPQALSIPLDFRLAEYQSQAVIALVEEGIWSREKVLFYVNHQVRSSERLLSRLILARFVESLVARWPNDADLRYYLNLLQSP